MSVRKEDNIKSKDIRFSIKIKPNDKKKIQDKAKSLGYNSTSKYIRDVLLNHRIVPKTDRDMIIQVRKIGVNINQIVHLANEVRDDHLIAEVYNSLKNEVDSLKEIVSKIVNNDC